VSCRTLSSCSDEIERGVGRAGQGGRGRERGEIEEVTVVILKFLILLVSRFAEVGRRRGSEGVGGGRGKKGRRHPVYRSPPYLFHFSCVALFQSGREKDDPLTRRGRKKKKKERDSTHASIS